VGKKANIALLISATVVSVAALSIAAYYFWSGYKVNKLAERTQRTYEIPKGVDYRNMTPQQQEDLFNSVSKVYPSRVTEPEKYTEKELLKREKKEKSKDFSVVRDIVFTSGQEPIPEGITPAEGDAAIDPTEVEDIVESMGEDDTPSQSGSDGSSSPDGSSQGDDSSTPPPPVPPKPAGTIFATKGVWNGNLGGLTGADAKCQTEAELEDYDGTWKAILGTSKRNEIIHPKDRIPDVQIVNTLGHIVAKNKADLLDGTISNPILYPDGTDAGGLTWTGSSPQGDGSLNVNYANQNLDLCGNWTCSKKQEVEKVNGCQSSAGLPNKLDVKWQYDADLGCNNTLHLYCVKDKDSKSGPKNDGEADQGDKDPGKNDQGDKKEPFKPESTLSGFTIKYFGYSREHGGGSSDPALEGKLKEIKSMVEKYFPRIVEIYGAPHNAKSRNMWILYNSSANNFDGFLYSSQFDILAVPNLDPETVVPGLIHAFHGKYAATIPETWQYGMTYAVADLVMRDDSEIYSKLWFKQGYYDGVRDRYELFNNENFPIWGAKIFYEEDILISWPAVGKRIVLASTAFLKPYQGNKEFFKKFNEKIYEQSSASSYWDNNDAGALNEMTSSFYTVEGEPMRDWYGKQHVLHQTETNPAKLNSMMKGQLFLLPEGASVFAYAFKTELEDGKTSLVPINQGGGYCNAGVKDDEGKEVALDDRYSKLEFGRYGLGVAPLWIDPAIEKERRYTVYIKPSCSIKSENYYTYVTDEKVKLRGIVQGNSFGFIEMYDARTEELIGSDAVIRGAFKVESPVSGLIEFKVFKKTGEDSDGDGIWSQIYEKKVGITSDKYFAILDPASDPYTGGSSGTRGSSPVPPPPALSPPAPAPEKECGVGWNEYTDKNGNYRLKYPKGWSSLGQNENTFGPGWSYSEGGKHWVDKVKTSSILTLSSTDDPMLLTDSSRKTGSIGVVTSSGDLKEDENYLGWFTPAGDSQKKSKITFKGVPAEVYEEDIDMPAGRYSRVYYYFQSSGIHYILDLSRYITPDVKGENEKFIKCFLESFEILGNQEPPGEEVPSDLKPCTPELLNASSSSCADLPEQTICGYERIYYPDVGESAIHAAESPNPCRFCSFFDENGYKELRGSQINVLGYKEENCE